MLSNTKLHSKKFQSTLPHGSDIKYFNCPLLSHHFNPRSLTGATPAFAIVAFFYSNFNPRSLTGATAGAANKWAVAVISIHAPSRERHDAHIRWSPITGISIHAPSRERQHYIREICNYLYFNPRSLTGATLQKISYLLSVSIFQSTLPHGSDYNYQHRYQWSMISIHAPSRERLCMLTRSSCIAAISIHAPSRERPGNSIPRQTIIHFNPRSLTGATDFPWHLERAYVDFNPRSLTGATSRA